MILVANRTLHKFGSLSPPNEKEKVFSDSFIREDESIEFVTKLKAMEYAQSCGICSKPERNFYRENNSAIENENRKTKFQVKLPKLQLKHFNKCVELAKYLGSF